MAFPLSILLVGGILTVRLKGVQFTRLGTAFKETLGKVFSQREKGRGLSPFQASATALAGALGTGNIAGVAVSLLAGGPGAIFWMWASAFLGMAVKYSEILLAVRFQRRDKDGTPSGGPMFYLTQAYRSELPAVFFAGSCAAASFGIGSLTQSGAASEALWAAFGVPRLWVGIAMALLALLVMVGGIRRIGAVAEHIVPMMGIVYLGGALLVLLPRLQELPGVFSLILNDAFSPQAASSGVLGWLTGRALRVGVSRGVFTNEAGMGSAPIAHGSADAPSPAGEGFWGIVEVFLDTVIMCTLTAAVILLSGGLSGETDGAALTVTAFRQFLGGGAAGFIAVSTCFFAFSSILCWSCYGEAALKSLSAKKGAITAYRLLYGASVVLGAVFQLETVFRLSDFLNFLMALPNLGALLLLLPIIEQETAEYFNNLHKKRLGSKKDKAKFNIKRRKQAIKKA